MSYLWLGQRSPSFHILREGSLGGQASSKHRFGWYSQGGVAHIDQPQELCRGVSQSSSSGSATASGFQRRLDQMISVYNQIYIYIYEHQASKKLTLSPSAAFPGFAFP